MLSKISCLIECHLLETHWTIITSLHPFIYATKMEMMRAFQDYFWVFFCIFFKACWAGIFIF
nr:hypothetical protein Iba_chr05cCG5390 [Ipomoea batatas]GMC99324.1 hypothetical protein Iba_chr05eCG4570 [Ipomoea batatas]GMD01042.1 hypothetical protein Iba_chr05fCG3640 [Ipomoea batatas]